MIKAICKVYPDIDPIFDPRDKVPFSAGTLNLGPQVVTTPHTDHANPAYGVCAVTALGRFNSDRGGHLVLPEFGVTIRFPPGATIILPSAAVVHYNIPVQPGEERFSIVQYTAAGLFRWWAHDYQTAVQYRCIHNIKAPEQRAKAAARLEAGINRFTLLREFGWEDNITSLNTVEPSEHSEEINESGSRNANQQSAWNTSPSRPLPTRQRRPNSSKWTKSSR